MIFTERKITIRNGKSTINEPVVLYRGDYEVSIKFTIMESKFRFKSGANLVDSEKASYGQLAILAPYGGNVFSEIVKCEDGTVTFTLTKEMIDQLEEVGLYSFQIRLFDYYRESRVSIPPVEFGIEVREPVASEDHCNSVNNAIVGYSIAKVVDPKEENVGDTFDSEGNYNKTDWETGDRITEGKLNKIEDALDKINQNAINDAAALDKRITSNYNVLDSKIDEVATKGTTSEVIKQSVEDEIDTLIETGELDAMTIPNYGIELYHINPDILDNAITSIELNWDNTLIYENAISASFMISKTLQIGDIVTFKVLLQSNREIPIQLGIYRSNRHSQLGYGHNSGVYNISPNEYTQCMTSMEITTDELANYSYIYCHIMSTDDETTDTTLRGLDLTVYVNDVAISPKYYVFVNHYRHNTMTPVVTCNVKFSPYGTTKIATLNSIEETGNEVFFRKDSVLKYDNFPKVFKFIDDDYSYNLFDKDDPDIVLGKYFYAGQWLNGSSNTIGGIEYSTSGFIPVDIGKTYSQETKVTCSFWDKDETFLYDGPMSQQILVPSDPAIRYIRISFVTSEIDNTMFVEGNEYPAEYQSYSRNALLLDKTNCVIDESLVPKIEQFTQWKNKKWYACGTSMTSTSWGRYTKYLAELSGLQETNLGVPGGTIANTNKPSIQQALLNIEDDADLITMEAGVNDWVQNVPLGQLGDKEPTTYYGALYTAFELLTSKPKARIVTITMHYGTQITDPWLKNAQGATQQDFNNALIEMSNFYSIPCIRLAEESGIGPNRYNLYLRDNIHHTELGGEVFAKFVWSKLKYIDPLQIEQ